MPNIDRDFARVCLRGLKKDRLTEILTKHYSEDPHLDEVDDAKEKDALVQRAVQELSDPEIVTAIFHGFRDRYNQWVYIRNLENDSARAISAGIQRLSGHKGTGDISIVESWSPRRGWNSVLLRVRQTVRCGVSSSEVQGIFLEDRDVFVPCLVTGGVGKLFVHVMSVSPDDWRPLLGQAVQQTIGKLKHDGSRDLVLSLLARDVKMRTVSPYDFTSNARTLMEHPDVHVASASGHFVLNAGQAGELKIEADLSTQDEMVGVDSLFKAEFGKIMEADSVRSARIQARNLVHGIPASRSLTILPMEGRVQIGSMMPGGDIFEILRFLVS